MWRPNLIKPIFQNRDQGEKSPESRRHSLPLITEPLHWASAGDTGSVPCPGRSHMPGAPEPVLRNKRSRHNEKPPPSHLEKSQVAVKTQHSQKKRGISGLEITESAPTTAPSCLNPTTSLAPQPPPALWVSLQKACPPDDTSGPTMRRGPGHALPSASQVPVPADGFRGALPPGHREAVKKHSLEGTGLPRWPMPRALSQQRHHWCVHTLSITRQRQPCAPGGCPWKAHCTHTGRPP